MKCSITKSGDVWRLHMYARSGLSLVSEVKEDHPTFESAEKARAFYVKNVDAFKWSSLDL